MRPIEKWIWLADDENNRNAYSPEQDINYLVAEFRRTYALRDAESGNGKRKIPVLTAPKELNLVWNPQVL